MLSGFDPLVAEWFTTRFGSPTEPQLLGWPEIRAGRDVLISAPTGSGKTLAAFLIAIDSLVRRARSGPLPDETEVVYVSPLKALSNDVHKNLEQPLAEILSLAEKGGVALAPIRAGLRTGDTTQADRQRMARNRPHILVTTPESLYILLTAAGPRRMLASTATVIVDEIHAVADDKRGSHLALTLARLDRLVEQSGRARPRRVGLSATVSPIEDVAAFLSEGASMVNVGHRREMEIAVESPRDEMGPVASTEMWDGVYDRLGDLIRENRTTLVFVNTRKLAERVAHHLGIRLGEGAVMPHHGSLSRAQRLAAEHALKNGELRAVVATASLELGIDIGTVDLVCQIGSPRSIGVALQRIGRSGHWVGALPKGRLFATTRDELVECAALVRAIRRGELDRLSIPSNALDILAQQMVAACACEDFAEDELFALMRRAWPYRKLERREFDAVLGTLSEGIATARGRSGAYLHRDGVNRVVRGRRGARLVAITSGGAIPDTSQYQVVAEPEGTKVGMLDEDFAAESNVGDVFLLGATSWRIRRVEAGRVRVEDAHGAAPDIPFWRGEAPGRTRELSRAVAQFREDVFQAREAFSRKADERADAGAAVHPIPIAAAQAPESTEEARAGGGDGLPGWLRRECGMDERGAEQAVEYVLAGRAALGAMPTAECVVAERFFDEAGGMQLIVHAPFGAAINRAWGLALRKRFCRTFNFELQAAATDNGLLLSLGEQHSFPLDVVFEFLRPETVEDVLIQALLAAPMFATRWRWNASRALAIPRYSGGRKIPAPIQRMRADDLMAAVFPDQAACPENLAGEVRIPDHPLVNETIRNCLHEAMDLDGLRAVLTGIRAGRIATVAVDTPEPSPFSHEILNSNPYAYLDDAPLEERRARAVQMRRTLPPDYAEGPGALDPNAIEQAAEEAWPPMRDAEELHEALCGLSVLPAFPSEHFAALAAQGRAAAFAAAGKVLWTAAERIDLVRHVYPEAQFEPLLAAPAEIPAPPDTLERCAAEILRGWFECSGPKRAVDFERDLALPRDLVDQALAQLEAEGQILRGHFTRWSRHHGPPGCEEQFTPEPATGYGPQWDGLPGLPSSSGASISGPVSGEESLQEAGRPEGLTHLEWCHRRILARIHRLTIGRLRREIEPVATSAFYAFLRRWQHLSAGGQLHGADGTLQVVKQLQGCEFPAASWEGEVLPQRVARYQPEYLDQICLSGEVCWGRLSPHPAFEREETDRHSRVRPSRVAPLAMFLREDAPWLLNGPQSTPREALSHPARETLAVLESTGACFFADLTRATGRLASEIEDALWELVAAGLVTADSFENLRALLDPRRRAGQGRGRSSRPRHAPGRWALLRRENGEHSASERTEAFARQLLRRWGVVFRDAAAREPVAPAWRDLLAVLRRMESRGEIRGGRFVAAFIGEQFALPEALDLLRAIRRTGETAEAPEGPGPWATLSLRTARAVA